jgi:hypothetical protein
MIIALTIPHEMHGKSLEWRIHTAKASTIDSTDTKRKYGFTDQISLVQGSFASFSWFFFPQHGTAFYWVRNRLSYSKLSNGQQLGVCAIGLVLGALSLMLILSSLGET